MDYQSFKQAIIARAAELGIQDYELYYQSDAETSVSIFAHEVNGFSSSEGGGVCFRCIVNGKMGYASTQALTEEEARNLVSQAAENAAVLESEEEVFLCEGGKTYRTLDRTPYELPTTEELIATALDTQEKLYAADPAVIDGTATNGLSMHFELAICNSKGLDLHYENNVSGLVAAAVVSDGKEMANDYRIKMGKLSELDTAAIAARTAGNAKCKLGGDVPPTAVCPVVFDSEAMSALLQTFSGIFSSENAQKGLSQLAGKEGEVIASPCVTLVDDPFHKDSPMPIPFDEEGCPTCTKNVIEKGELKTLLYNMKTANLAGKETTGNGSKAGYDGPVGIRPFTMYLAGGEFTEDELLAKAGEGVYINSLGGLHAGANPISGDFSLQSSGFLIRGGKKTDYVKSFTVAGNFYDVLKNITAVGNDLELQVHSMGSTNFGAPSTLVENLSIAGK